MKLGTKIVNGIGAAAKGMRPILLLAPSLFLASTGSAQNNVAPTPAMALAQMRHTNSGTAQSMLAAKSDPPKPEQKPASATTPATTPTKGTHEGIQVHGYWTIEVRNPDGTVTAHREFENAIQSTGQTYLEALLEGYASPGGLVIALNGANMSLQEAGSMDFGTSPNWQGFFPMFVDPGPCPPYNYNFGYWSGGPATGTTCLIVDPPTSTTASWLSGLCLGVSSTSCSANLSVSGLPLFGGTQVEYGAKVAPLSLSGSVTVPSTSQAPGVSAGTINDVETVFTTCQGLTPQQCMTIWNPSLSTPVGAVGWLSAPVSQIYTFVFTQKTLNGQNGDPAPVPYQPGQTIAVTVQISFQ